VKPGALAYVTGTYQHIGSRYTQVGDQEPRHAQPAVVRPQHHWRTVDGFHVHLRSEAASYDLMNLRAGVRRGRWDVSAFLNNLFDERAFLSFDQERGTRARIGYLTNQPRTFGLSTRVDF
jgi:iron complex outermembrane receptor protein